MPLNDTTHVLAGGAWLGAPFPVLPILRDLDDGDHRREGGIAVRRFSTAGHAAVAIVIFIGVANTVLVLGRWPTDRSSPYQIPLAAKVILAVAMTVLALLRPLSLRAKDGLGPLHILASASRMSLPTNGCFGKSIQRNGATSTGATLLKTESEVVTVTKSWPSGFMATVLRWATESVPAAVAQAMSRFVETGSEIARGSQSILPKRPINPVK